MELNALFRSVLEQDPSAIVLCGTDHTVVYMNPAAITRYASRGGASLVGRSLLDCHGVASQAKIRQVVAGFSARTGSDRVFTYHNPAENKDVYMVALRDADGALIGYYEKHEYRTRETCAPYTGASR